MKHPEATIQALKEACLNKEREPERVFEELCQLLRLATAEDLLRFAPILGEVIPELGATIGFQQHSPHHAYDVFTHTAHVVAGVSGDMNRRWAALLHDVGKVPTFTRDETGRGHFYGHAQKSAEMADDILRRLNAPEDLREDVVFLIENHMLRLEPDKELLRHCLARYGWTRTADLLALQWADFTSKGVMGTAPDFSRIDDLLTEIYEENACHT